jgi:cysteine synthase
MGSPTADITATIRAITNFHGATPPAEEIGVDVTVVCNEMLTEDKRQLIDYFGRHVVANDFGSYTYDGNRKCRAMLEQPGDRTYCFLDQLHNWDNPRTHEIGTGLEILRDMRSANRGCDLRCSPLG